MTHDASSVGMSQRRLLLLTLLILSVAVAFVYRKAFFRPPGGPPSVRVIGTITLDGAPLADGDVALDGLDGNPPCHAVVSAGRFELAIAPGVKRVQVHRYKETGQIEVTGRPVMISLIPERYNAATELRAEVTPSGPNEFAFDLRSR